MAKQKKETEKTAITFTGKYWKTHDGREFNSRLKAERHLQQIESEATGESRSHTSDKSSNDNLNSK